MFGHPMCEISGQYLQILRSAKTSNVNCQHLKHNPYRTSVVVGDISYIIPTTTTTKKVAMIAYDYRFGTLHSSTYHLMQQYQLI